jgi:aerobic carbon-monoxide dehydrogenase medium subunit
MRPVKFDFKRPQSVAEAIQLLSSTDNSKLLAGGHSLIPSLNLRLSQPSAVIDIGRIPELKGINVDGNSVIIGAATPHAQIASSPSVKAHSAALASACGRLADPHVRNWGTLGGNLAHADPASDPPPVVLALGGTIYLQGPNGSRNVPAKNFFVDLFTTDLQAGEILTRISLPIVSGRKSAYAKLEHPASRYAVVGICAVLDMQGNVCTSASIAVGGATPKATLSAGASAALSGKVIDDAAINAAASALMNEIRSDAMSDVYADATYRTAMAGEFLKRAVKAALAS